MKYLSCLLLIVFLSGCSSPAGRAVSHIGNQVTNCCSSLSLDKNCASSSPLTHAAEQLPVSLFEVSGKIPVW